MGLATIDCLAVTGSCVLPALAARAGPGEQSSGEGLWGEGPLRSPESKGPAVPGARRIHALAGQWVSERLSLLRDPHVPKRRVIRPSACRAWAHSAGYPGGSLPFLPPPQVFGPSLPALSLLSSGCRQSCLLLSSCPTLCHPTGCGTPGLPCLAPSPLVHSNSSTGDAIQPSQP